VATGTDSDVASDLYALAARLYPIGRSLTGDGVRETLRILQTRIPLEIHEVPTGTTAFDWTIPQEWNVRQAWVADAAGRRLVDYAEHNLHLVGYSVPVRARVSRDELLGRLHSLPDQPDAIPYRTSYYGSTWGFCVRARDLERFVADEFEVCVDTRLEDGSLTYGEVYLPGETDNEVLLSTHVCHPSLANDNVSGLVVATALAERLAAVRRRNGIRLVFTPGTIGSIAWLSRNEERLPLVRAGLVLACLGDRGGFTFKRSRHETSELDRVVEHVLAERGTPYDVRPFAPTGYDERQFCSPGIDLPVGRLTRTPNGEYPEYHTSLDDLDLLQPHALAESLDVLLDIVDVLERNETYVNLVPKGEPQLGRRGLYRSSGGAHRLDGLEDALLWVLNLGDGRHTLLDVARRSGIPFHDLDSAARALAEHGLVEARGRR
jgi:aminopeptidase-like protein